MQSISCEMLACMNHKLESRLLEEISKPQTYKWYYFNGRKWRGTKDPLEESEKVGWKLNIQKTKIIASGTIILWQIEREKVETITNFIFLGYKITEDSECSHEIKTLASWKKNYDKHRQCIKKQRYHFTNKGPYSQIMVCSQSYMDMRVEP